MIFMLMYLPTNKSFQYVFKQKDLNLRLRRWLELLKNYDMSVFITLTKKMWWWIFLVGYQWIVVLILRMVRRSWFEMFMYWPDWVFD